MLPLPAHSLHRELSRSSREQSPRNRPLVRVQHVYSRSAPSPAWVAVVPTIGHDAAPPRSRLPAPVWRGVRRSTLQPGKTNSINRFNEKSQSSPEPLPSIFRGEKVNMVRMSSKFSGSYEVGRNKKESRTNFQG